MVLRLLLLLLLHCSLLGSYYCPEHHRHVGSRHVLRLVGDAGGVGGVGEWVQTEESPMPTPQYWTQETHSDSGETLSCPIGCVCLDSYDSIKVSCAGQFLDHFPIDMLPQDTSILIISPDKEQNQLTLGPTFRLLHHLTSLSVTHSSIPNIGQRTLWGLTNLRSLNLSHNAISHVVAPNFDGLISLTSLILDYNSIKSITSAAFHHLPRLELLSLAHNHLTELAPRIFLKLNTLKVLNLSSNNLLVVDEEAFKDIRNIQKFSCNSCGLSSFKVSFSLRFLRDLELAGNRIRAVEDVEAHILRGLTSLDMSHNMVTEVKRVQSNKMKVMMMARNNIRSIDQCAFCETELLYLDLSYNHITHLASVFPHPMRSLTNLSLSGNTVPVEELGVILTKFSNLEELQVAETSIISVPEELFKENKKLRLVNLSSNYLISLEQELLSSLPVLSHLDLSHNLLMGLEESLLSTVDTKPGLELVYLQGNPWVCDQCHLQPLVQWLHTSLMYWGSCFPPDSSMCLVCNSPSSLNNTPIISLETLPECSTIPPDSKSMTSTVTSLSQYLAICVLLAVLLIVLVMVVSKYRHYGVYLTGEEEDKESNILTNPVTVLDKNSESYIDLRYPTIRGH